MSFRFKVFPAALAAAFLLMGPSAAFADRKDGEKQRWERRGAWSARTESEKEWRKEQKEREKDRREALKERQKDRREAAREWEKDRREAEREWDKDRREAAREARKNSRDRDYRYPRTNRVPYPIP